jgi:hypothetical protein
MGQNEVDGAVTIGDVIGGKTGDGISTGRIAVGVGTGVMGLDGRHVA